MRQFPIIFRLFDRFSRNRFDQSHKITFEKKSKNQKKTPKYEIKPGTISEKLTKIDAKSVNRVKIYF